MKNTLVYIILLATTLYGVADDNIKKVKLNGISRPEQIIGYLNEPFGTVISVIGRVKMEPPLKGYHKKIQDRYFVVTHIKGEKLDKPIKFDLWSQSLPNAQNGDVVEAKAYERLMMLGIPKGLPAPTAQGRAKDFEYRLYRYIHVITSE